MRAVDYLRPENDGHPTLSQGVDGRRVQPSQKMDSRGLGLSLLPRTRNLTHALLLQTSASITLLWFRRLGANAACLCCRTRCTGCAPSGAATPLRYFHVNPRLRKIVLALVANSWRLLRASRFRATRTSRKVETTLAPEVVGVHGKCGGIDL
jgi:hypothetical protein